LAHTSFKEKINITETALPHAITMQDHSPTLDEWSQLYKAAREFKELACWDWMMDNQIFGVQNPATGEVGYCSVMGNNREHFALGVYKGLEGLTGLIDIMEGFVVPDDMDALHVQHCLMASFEDRRFILDRDYEVIRKLGIRFRGKHAWPLFRDYTPGYHPWYISSDDSRFLTVALNQAMDVVQRVKDDPEQLVGEDYSVFLTRVPHDVDGTLRWKDEWLEVQVPEEAEASAGVPVDEKRLESIKRKKTRGTGIWEIGSFFSPKGVQEKGERPYYPRVTLFLDPMASLILSFSMSEPSCFEKDLVPFFLGLLEKSERLPKDILVSEEEILELLLPITGYLGIELYKEDYLEHFEDAKHSMCGFFGHR